MVRLSQYEAAPQGTAGELHQETAGGLYQITGGHGGHLLGQRPLVLLHVLPGTTQRETASQKEREEQERHRQRQTNRHTDHTLRHGPTSHSAPLGDSGACLHVVGCPPLPSLFTGLRIVAFPSGRWPIRTVFAFGVHFQFLLAPFAPTAPDVELLWLGPLGEDPDDCSVLLLRTGGLRDIGCWNDELSLRCSVGSSAQLLREPSPFQFEHLSKETPNGERNSIMGCALRAQSCAARS